MRLLILITMVTGLPVSAFAQRPTRDFERHQQVSQFTAKAVSGFRVTGAKTIDRVLVGMLKTKWGLQSGVVLVSCAKQCSQRRYKLGKARRIESIKLVDLAGSPTSFVGSLAGSSSNYRQLRAGRLRFPVLVIRTKFLQRSKARPRGGSWRRNSYEGPEVSHQLIVVSLRRVDFQRAVLFHANTYRRDSSGYGVQSRFRLVRDKRQVLDIAETRLRLYSPRYTRRHRPKRTQHRHVLKNGHYRETK